MKFSCCRAAAMLLGLIVAGTSPAAPAGSGNVTLIQAGDIHGHLVPRPNLRSDARGNSTEGGVARMYTVIQRLRAEATENGVDRSLLINTGDTLQGSGEALFSRGQAMIDVLNRFGFVAHAPGNWDFLYGTARFEETFKGPAPLANWNALSSNLYYTNQFDDSAVCGVTATDPSTGTTRPRKRVLPTYRILQVGNVKVGILGFTTARAIAAVGTSVTAGYMFTDAKAEVPCFVDRLRNVEGVDVVVMISELEMARDIQIAETISPAPDVILNSDMHERTTAPIVIQRADGTQTLIVEQGQDGTTLGQLKLQVKNGKVAKWHFNQHVVTDDIPEDAAVAAKVAEVRAPYVAGSFVPGQTVVIGGNTTELPRPVDEVIAHTHVGLHRSNFMDEDLPGVVEGTSHNLIADAMRTVAGSDTAAIRGFRYGTHIPAGWPITMEDIYHYVPIAAKLGRSTKACGADLKFQIEQSSLGAFHSDPSQWAGGWLFGYSGVSFDFDACDGFTGPAPAPINGPTLALPSRPWGTFRGTNIRVNGTPINVMDLYDGRPVVGGVANPNYQKCTSGAEGFRVAGYWYADDPTTINNCNPCRGRLIQAVKTDGTIVNVAGPGVSGPLPASLEVMDVTEAVVKYLRENLNGIVTGNDLTTGRISVRRLPTVNPYSFRVIQPLKGASAATCPAL